MKRKLVIIFAIIVIPVIILVLDYYVLNETINYDWNYIVSHQDQYPSSLLNLMVNNQETASFVASYPAFKDQNTNIDISKELSEGEIPLMVLWDERWGYRYYGDQMFVFNGSGPLCLSMVLCYLKGESQYNPYYLAKYSFQKGYYHDGYTDSSFLSEGAQKMGLTVQSLTNDEKTIRNALNNDEPIIYMYQNEYFVITKYEDGLYYIHDPHSVINSRGYTYDEIADHIDQLWCYQYN